MIYSQIDQSNLKISRLGLGTVSFGCDYATSKVKTQAEVDQILNACLKLKINYLDTAQAYGDSEQKIGNYLKSNPKSKFIVSTKLPKYGALVAKDKTKLRDAVFNSVKQSLKNLNQKQLDVLQLHQLDEYITLNEDFWSVVRELKQKGLIKAFGVSVYEVAPTVKLVRNFGKVIDTIQLPFNILDRRFEKEFKLFNKNKISVITRATFLSGVLASSGALAKEWNHLKKYKNELVAIALENKMSLPELALGFVLNCSMISSTVVSVDNIAELSKNVDVFKKLKQVSGLKENLSKFMIKDYLMLDPRKRVAA